MKAIGIATVSLAAAILCAHAGELPSLPLTGAESQVQPFALAADRPAPNAAVFVSIESSDPTRLQLDRWLLAGANPDSFPRDAVAQYLEYGRGGPRSFFSRAKVAAILSRAPAVPGPMVRLIEVVYEGASARRKAEILAHLKTRVGRHYFAKLIEEDSRKLTATGAFASVRIFGVPLADGVKVIVVLKTESEMKAESALHRGGSNFNIGYEF